MKNKTAFTILTILVLSFLLYLSGGIFVHHGSAKNSESIAADIDLLTQMEAKTPTDFSSRKIESFSGDLTEEQEKIIAMKDDSFDNSEMTKWFEDVIILGDSIVEGGSAYEWLTHPTSPPRSVSPSAQLKNRLTLLLMLRHLFFSCVLVSMISRIMAHRWMDLSLITGKQLPKSKVQHRIL